MSLFQANLRKCYCNRRAVVVVLVVALVVVLAAVVAVAVLRQREKLSRPKALPDGQ